MKKQTKILALILCFVLLIGVVAVSVFAETGASNILLEDKEYGMVLQADSKAKKAALPSNIAGNNIDKISIITLDDTTTKPAGSFDYFTIGDMKSGKKVEGNLADASYYVIDFDMCTADTWLPIEDLFLKMTVNVPDGSKTWGGASYGHVDVDGMATFTVNGVENKVQLNTAPFAWQHFTIMYDFANGKVAIYIDGALAHLDGMFKFPETTGVQEFNDLRIEISKSTVLPAGHGSICMANAISKVYNSESLLDTFTDETVSELYAGATIDELSFGESYELVCQGYTVPTPENLYEVSGEAVRTFEVACAKAIADGSNTVKVLHDVKVPVVINSDIVIDKNGKQFAYSSVGYEKVENGELITFTKSTVEYNVEFYDGDTLLEAQKLLVGQKVACDKATANKTVDGKTFTFVGWTSEKGSTNVLGSLPTASSDAKYYAVYIEASYIVTDERGNTTYYGDDKLLVDVLQAAPKNATIKFGKDAILTKTYNITKNVTIDLNGFKLTHKDRFTANQNCSLTIINGTIDAANKNVVYFSKPGAKLVIDNCTIISKSAISDVRDGVVHIKNSTIEALDCGNNFLTGGYRGTTQEFLLEDCIVNMHRPNADLLGLGRAKGEGGKQITKVEFRGVTINGILASLVRVNNEEAGAAASSVRVIFDGNCVFNSNNSLVKVSGIEDTIVTFADGVEFIETPRLVPYQAGGVQVGKCIYGTGSSVPVRISNEKCVIAPKNKACLVTWKAGDYEVSDFWKKDIVPEVPAGVGFKFVSNSPVEAVTKDVIYEGVFAYDEIKLMQNLTLYSDLTFNVYVSKTAGIKALALGGSEILDLTQAEVYGEYYVIRLGNINPLTVGTDIVLTITREGPGGVDTFEKTTLNVTNYAKAILEGNFSKEAKTLVANTIAYADAACVAYGKTAEANYANITALKALVDANKTTVAVPTTEATMAPVASALASAQLKLDVTTKLRFNITPEFTGTIVVEYTKNGTVVTDTYEVAAGKVGYVDYIEIDARAFELAKDVKVTVGEAVGTYNIMAYYAAMEQAEVKTLVQALYNYAASAEAYKAVITK